ncbi:MAG: hypothetical protein WC673_01965 [Candidatus Paceibacterota bacterium]|jgi:hypothetical protein
MNDERKIEKHTWVFMLAIAGFIDLVQIIAGLFVIGIVVNTLLDIFIWITFYIWFKIYGVNFISVRRGLPFVGAGLVEIIPALNVLPAWTVAIAIMWITTKSQVAATAVTALKGRHGKIPPKIASVVK